MLRKIISCALIAVLALQASVCSFATGELRSLAADYVVAYLNGSSTSSGESTGTVSSSEATPPIGEGNQLIKLDYHPKTDPAVFEEVTKIKNGDLPVTKATYSQGDKTNFIVLNARTNQEYTIQFECVKVGTYCYVWTPTSTSYTPLSMIGETAPTVIANEFDTMFPKMVQGFGQPVDIDGSGKIHLACYDIIDGYSGSGSFIAGYFWGGDMYSSYNGKSMLHIDTYPLMTNMGIDESYSTMTHELQHLINYSKTGGMASWLNEAMSMAAEELIYPGSALPSRIYTYNNYNSYPSYHDGKSLYNWDSTLAAYGINCLFGQYLRVHTGSYSIFAEITDKYAQSGVSLFDALLYALDDTPLGGLSIDELNLSFRTALVAKESTGLYGFKGESAFDSVGIHPISSAKTVYQGGAVVIACTNGVYNIPANAGRNLKYICIKNGSVVAPPTGIAFSQDTLDMTVDEVVDIPSVTITPTGSQTSVTYSSSDTSVVQITSENKLLAKKEGTATITATTLNGLTATLNVTVSPAAPPIIPGDVNADEKVNLVDAILILRMLAGWDLQIEVERADFDGNGSISAVDALLILRSLID